MRSKNSLCLLRLWLFVTVATVAGASVLPALAQGGLTIESPRHGSTISSSTLPRPQGNASSPSRVRGVQVLLQRASNSAWLSWDGYKWSNALRPQTADFNAQTSAWAWPQHAALPSSALMVSGNYRLQAASIASNGSVLARVQSEFMVGGRPVRREAPGNDSPLNAIPISGPSGSVGGTTVDSSPHNPDGGVPGGLADPDVFWKWTAGPEAGQIVTFSTAGSSAPSGDLVLSIYSRAWFGLQQVGGGTDSAQFVAEPGAEYLIEVSTRLYGGRGALALSWSTRYRPTNDAPGNATPISGASGNATGTTIDTGPHNPDGGVPGGIADPDVFWKWTAGPEAGQIVTFSTAGSSAPSGDLVLSIYSRRAEGWHGVGSGTDSAQFVAEPGVEYLIEVSTRFYGGRGTVALSWSTRLRPANDLRANAFTISGASGRTTGTNAYAQGEGPYPGDPNNPAAPDVWWKWKAPLTQGQNVTFTTGGSNFDNFIAVFTLRNGVLQVVASVPSFSLKSSVRFAAEAGREYFISVYGWRGATGAITLNWSTVLSRVVTGRVLNQNGQPQKATVFLVPGDFIDPLLFRDSSANLLRVTTAADGTYSFTGVTPGPYLVVPMASTLAFTPQATRVTASDTGPVTANFRVLSVDTVGPELTVTGMTRSLVNGTNVVSSASGTVTDRNGTLAPSGTLLVGYNVYRLRSDAISLRVPPGRRPIEAIFSDRTGTFIASDGTRPITLETTTFARLTGNTWATTFDPALQRALNGGGTYRIVLFALDKAFNTIRHSATSTDPDRPAGKDVVYGHFETSVANLAVTRTLPLSVPNGNTITYAYSISNTGDQSLYNVAVRQTINTDKTVLIGTSISPRASAIQGADVVWSLGTIAPHSTRLLKLQVKASDNNPFGSNIAAGKLSVTSSDRNYVFGRDQINIETSNWVIGGALKALRAVGDAIGSAFNYVFGTSTRDQRAQADLNTIVRTSVVTRLVGADAIRFGNGAMLIPIGGGKIVAAGGGNIVAAGGGNIVAAGAGNMVAAGAGNLVNISGYASSYILSQLVSNPGNVLAHNAGIGTALRGANLALLNGNNIVAAGAGNAVSTTGNNIVAAGAGSFVDNQSGLLVGTRVRLVGPDGASLVGPDGASLRGLDGAGIIGNAGGNLKLAGGRGNTLIGMDGASLIGMDGASLIGPDGAS